MGVNLAVKYSSKLDQLFTAGSYMTAMSTKSTTFTGAKTVEVYTATTVDPTTTALLTGDRLPVATQNFRTLLPLIPSVTINPSRLLSTVVTTSRAH